MKLQPIIYLDTAFITEAYESFKGQPVPMKVVRTENISGGISAGLFNVGATSQEAKEYPISSRAMYKAMEEELESYPKIDLSSTNNNELPDYFWATGTFAVGTSQVTSDKQVIHRDSYYRLYLPGAEKKGVYLLTNDAYFSAGYDQILKHVHGASRGFGIQVRAFVKFLARQENNFWPLCAPMIMERTSE